MRLIATCAVGLEPLLKDELEALGFEPQGGDRGAVAFEGGWPAVWRANHWLRTANRVLLEIATWSGQDGDALYSGARNLVRRRKIRDGLDFGRLLSPEKTFAVRATSAVSKERDVRWIGLRVKDGLVDGQRDRHGRRSSVDRDRPDIQLRVRLFKNQATLLLDTSGEPLDHRGYRLTSVAAPLRETLAAAAAMLTEWKGEGPIIDPMCGSGTLLAEAAWWISGRAPSSLRASFPYENLPGFNAKARKEAVAPPPRNSVGAGGVELIGLDRDPVAVAVCEANLAEARLGSAASIWCGDAFDWQPPEGPGLVLINPPYGERLRSAPDAWKHLGDLLKRRYTGKTAVVVAGGEDQGKTIGLRPRRRLPVKNGPLDARLLVFDLY